MPRLLSLLLWPLVAASLWGPWAGASAQYWDPGMEDGREVMVLLTEWKWTDIAQECEKYLGPNGFGGVQISPPNEHAVLESPHLPWWQRYLPVSYKLQSRSGTEEELRDMVKRCNLAGVRIYADVVINHMANGELSEGSAGSLYDPETLSYPQVPYGPGDFSVHNLKCPSKSGTIEDHKDVTEVRNCNLAGFPDLDTSVHDVRHAIAKYMNTLLAIGVAGFRVSNAEHIWPGDLAAIYASLDDLSGAFFKAGHRPFVFHEVNSVGANADAVKPVEYLEMGSVTDFEFGQLLAQAVRGGSKMTLSDLDNMEDDFSLVPSSGAVAFVDNADTQRYDALTYKESTHYVLANAFMLAYPYGVPRVMSSFEFGSYDEGPPSDETDATLPVTINEDGSCGNEWICEHRWPQVRNMVAFKSAADGQPLSNWWSNGDQQVAFGRGDKAFIVLNNERVKLSEFLYTGLPSGEYCDVISGDFIPSSSQCTGQVVSVDALGFATFTLSEGGPPVSAIHVNAVVRDTEQIVPDTGSQPPAEDVGVSGPTLQRTTIFLYKPMAYGQSLFLRGGRGGGCSGECDVPITHITPGENAQYNAWKTGDTNLDWNGAEEGQEAYEGIPAQGTPLVWTTNDADKGATVDTDGYGYTPLNQWGDHYWMVDLEVDCSKTDDGWFELKGFLVDGGWENDVSQDDSCQGNPGGSKPSSGNNHFARCGFINVFKFEESECTIDSYTQAPSQMPSAATEIPPNPPPIPPIPPTGPISSRDSKDKPSTDEKNPSVESAPSPTETKERTTIFIYKPTYFGQSLFIRGGLTKNCGDSCDVPISHITPGKNAQYNAWKTGDTKLDWNGAEEGQEAYEGIPAQGTPLVWTTNDADKGATVDTDGYGYTPLNQWGDHYWMVDLEVDCSKTDDGWFELKGFVLNGQGWEADIYQNKTCQGSAGGSKPFDSINHFARCGFVNVFKFEKNECTINEYEQASSRALEGEASESPNSDKPSTDETNPSAESAPSPTETKERTTIFIYKPTYFGQSLFIRGGLTKNCGDSCDVPISHITPGENAQYNAWKTGDTNLDWNGEEEGQEAYEGISAQGTPLVWTTNDADTGATVDTDGYGYTPLNQWGDHYWMVDLDVDCSKTDDGWFELKGFVLNGQGWEADIYQNKTCQGSAGGSKPFDSFNHFARCGFVNVFKFEENECTINEYEQASSRALEGEASENPNSDKPSTDETNPSAENAPSPTETKERTTIFIYKPTYFGQSLFIRGGLTKNCGDSCDVPISHITPGENAQYNAWKTGDTNLDWNGAEEGQEAYEGIPAQGTPLVWTTNDADKGATVDTDGYGYTPLNQWGDHYWMVDLEIDCSKTDDGWFELKGFLLNGQGWEADVYQNKTCQGSAGGSKPFDSINHIARCGFVNVFKFEESECTINEYEQASSRALEGEASENPNSDKPSTDETNPSAENAPSPTETKERTTIFIYKPTYFGQSLFIRGGLTKNCGDSCDVPISHITPGENAQYNAWKTGDTNLDWNGAEEGQEAYEGISAQGTPLVWTTNDADKGATVDTDGYGYTPLNQWGDHYWMVDLEVDCSKTDDGWFELKGFLLNGQGWEADVYQNKTCQGSAGGSKPFDSINHIARCGFVNVFKFEESECTINEYEQASSRALEGEASENPNSDKPSTDETNPSAENAPSPTETKERTTIFIYKPTYFGQSLFIRGGLTKNCGDSCDVPISHITRGENAQYNAWKTGDTNLDWNGAEEGQEAYEGIPAQGTPLVWTTSDADKGATVDTDGYGYTPLNQWGDHYWMVDLKVDCSKTDDGWFDLKGFLLNGQGWEADVYQNKTCQGSAGGSKPFDSINHVARCGFINVFKFEESECTINEYEQASSRALEGEASENPNSDKPSTDETNPSAENAPSPTETKERTTIFIYKPTYFGQSLFIRGGLTKNCGDSCDVPISHITPGKNAQYNAWKTGDTKLDWNGAEEGQEAYEGIPAQGTPLVWTTNDANKGATVDTDGYGYTPLNQWGDHYWMVDLEVDCSKTDDGWFELKGFLLNGQGWEADVYQNKTCQGSAGGSKPFDSINHIARCGFVNVFKFEESECTINEYEQASSRALEGEASENPNSDKPSTDETNPSAENAPSPTETKERTTIFIYKPTYFGQSLFIRGGLTKNCGDSCDVPISHITPGENAQYNAWKTGDTNLDWNGAEEGQEAYEGISAQGTPLVWTTNDADKGATVDTDGYGYTPLNQWGDHYWMVDLEVDCSKTDDGWFELKGFLLNGQGWEADVYQNKTCQGSAGGSKPFDSINHFARCGFVNVFKFEKNECTINEYEQASSRALEGEASENPNSDKPSTDETNPSAENAPSPTETKERTTIFIYKPTYFGQSLFIRGGLTKNCGDSCDVPISHITPGENAQYNAWKTGDTKLDWNGAEEGQEAYEGIPAQGTPLVWTTNDANKGATVDTDGYGYTPLNQWGDHYWMVDLEVDCSKTDDGWFELKGFLLNGQGWEADVYQNKTCQGSAGGSKPFDSINHIARCGFVNVFKFEESECTINEYEQASSRALEGEASENPNSDKPSTDETNPSAENAPSPTETKERTTIFIYKPTYFGQSLFIRGGLTKNCGDSCDVPISHITPGENAQYNAWKTGDTNLDWNGAEEGQEAYEGISAQGTPLVWTTNDADKGATVDTDGYGYTPLNQWGDHYWMVDLEVDCSKTDDGWFELKGFLLNGQGWEADVYQNKTCQGSAGGSKPFDSINHFARCGFVNVFKFEKNECTINEYEQASSRALEGEASESPNSDKPSTDETNPSAESAPSPTETKKRTTIFIYKPTYFGQSLFIRGGLTRNCGDSCDVPISHITPGENAQYNAWKTGDANLDWNGAEEGQEAYEGISAQGTPLVWTTNDADKGATVDTDGYGYTPLNQWGDHYWMVDLEVDCSKTDDGWFELKGFLLNGQGWEADVYQNKTCQGSAGGSKPFDSINHIARCGFVNVFKFEESECTINEYEQASSRALEGEASENPNSDKPSTDETNPSAENAPSPTETKERTTIFIYKPTYFGQSLFIRGGLTRNCGDSCDVPISHITPGKNAQYNAWKTGDTNLDWNGAEEGQEAYEGISAQGTPLVWTTNDADKEATVDTDGYGYTPLNQWGDHYWMVDLEVDCSKTDDGWFELKGFLLNGQGWEADVYQNKTCQGSAGGSKPFDSINHIARCGFVNVFKFEESECTINYI